MPYKTSITRIHSLQKRVKSLQAFYPIFTLVEAEEIQTMDLENRHTGVRFSHLEQSYAVMQQSLQAFFPADAEVAYDEMVDLYEEEWQAKQQHRGTLQEYAEQLKRLFLEGLREETKAREEPRWRVRMLYRLAALFELAVIIDPTVVESLASKIAVSYEQGVASAVLKVLAEDSHISRKQIEDDLSGLDASWHHPHVQLSQRVVTLFDAPTFSVRQFVEKYKSLEDA